MPNHNSAPTAIESRFVVGASGTEDLKPSAGFDNYISETETPITEQEIQNFSDNIPDEVPEDMIEQYGSDQPYDFQTDPEANGDFGSDEPSAENSPEGVPERKRMFARGADKLANYLSKRADKHEAKGTISERVSEKARKLGDSAIANGKDFSKEAIGIVGEGIVASAAAVESAAEKATTGKEALKSWFSGKKESANRRITARREAYNERRRARMDKSPEELAQEEQAKVDADIAASQRISDRLNQVETGESVSGLVESSGEVGEVFDVERMKAIISNLTEAINELLEPGQNSEGMKGRINGLTGELALLSKMLETSKAADAEDGADSGEPSPELTKKTPETVSTSGPDEEALSGGAGEGAVGHAAEESPESEKSVAEIEEKLESLKDKKDKLKDRLSSIKGSINVLNDDKEHNNIVSLSILEEVETVAEQDIEDASKEIAKVEKELATAHEAEQAGLEKQAAKDAIEAVLEYVNSADQDDALDGLVDVLDSQQDILNKLHIQLEGMDSGASKKALLAKYLEPGIAEGMTDEVAEKVSKASYIKVKQN